MTFIDNFDKIRVLPIWPLLHIDKLLKNLKMGATIVQFASYSTYTCSVFLEGGSKDFHLCSAPIAPFDWMFFFNEFLNLEQWLVVLSRQL